MTNNKNQESSYCSGTNMYSVSEINNTMTDIKARLSFTAEKMHSRPQTLKDPLLVPSRKSKALNQSSTSVVLLNESTLSNKPPIDIESLPY